MGAGAGVLPGLLGVRVRWRPVVGAAVTPDAFCELHLRLVLDSHAAFRSLGENRIRVLPAGKSWLDDHARYLSGWLTLESHGYHVPTVLNKRFGYVIDNDTQDVKTLSSTDT